MSRSGYNNEADDGSAWSAVIWRGTVANSIRGKRGQAMLRDLLTALDAMPDKQLIAESLQTPRGGVCALGSLGAARGINMTLLDPEDSASIAKTFNVAAPLIREISWLNDEGWYRPETPKQRWARMRQWVQCQITAAP